MNNLTQKYKIIKVLSIKISFRDAKKRDKRYACPSFFNKIFIPDDVPCGFYTRHLLTCSTATQDFLSLDGE